MSSWIGTFTGRQFDVFDPDPDQIDIEDIATALSRMPRFAGHTREFYSVAQHSFHVSRLCSNPNALAGLLHDATEAYLVDVPRPIKYRIPEYKTIEDNLMSVIAEKFGIQFPFNAEVKRFDDVLLETEHRDLMPVTPVWTTKYADPVDWKIDPKSHKVAKEMFLQEFYFLYQQNWHGKKTKAAQRPSEAYRAEDDLPQKQEAY